MKSSKKKQKKNRRVHQLILEMNNRIDKYTLLENIKPPWSNKRFSQKMIDNSSLEFSILARQMNTLIDIREALQTKKNKLLS